MAGSRWTELYRSLRPPAQLATVGGLAILGSLLLPWYGLRLTGGLAMTGLDSFGVGQLALVLTVAAALYLIVRGAGGYRLPRPLHEGTLLAAAGAWAALLVGYLMLDRPDRIAGFTELRLRYGIFVALGGAIAICVGGLQLRHQEVRAERAGGDAQGE